MKVPDPTHALRTQLAGLALTRETASLIEVPFQLEVVGFVCIEATIPTPVFKAGN
jgi:hypothetical protein